MYDCCILERCRSRCTIGAIICTPAFITCSLNLLGGRLSVAPAAQLLHSAPVVRKVCGVPVQQHCIAPPCGAFFWNCSGHRETPRDTTSLHAHTINIICSLVVSDSCYFSVIPPRPGLEGVLVSDAFVVTAVRACTCEHAGKKIWFVHVVSAGTLRHVRACLECGPCIYGASAEERS